MASKFEYGARVWRSGLRGMALSLLASTAILGGPVMLSPARAQVNATVDFAIPSGSLGSAISRFGDRSNLQLLYAADLVRGRTTPGVSGRMTPAEALSRLLAGTGLDYSFTDARTVTITSRGAAGSGSVPAPNGSLVLDTIDVNGGGQNSVYSPYVTAAPTTYISSENIQRFRGSSPADMFRGTPGVMSGEARNGAGSIDVNIRGLQGMGRVTTTVDGAENAVTIYQGYQGISNRTYVDPDFIAGVDIQKGADASYWGNAGAVAMRTLNADDIVKSGETWAVRLKGGFGTNTTSPVAGNKAGYLFTNPLGWSDPTTGYGSATPSSTGMDRPSFLSPTSGWGSVVAAYKGENIDLLAGYARRSQGNYFAGENGQAANPVSIGQQPFCYSSGVCPPEYLYRDYIINGGAANYRAGEEVLNTELETESWLAKMTAHIGEDHTLQLGYTGYRAEAGDRMASALAGSMGQAVQQANTTGTSLDTLSARYRWNPADSDLFDLKANAYWSHLEQRNPIRGGRWGVTPETLGLGSDFRVGSDSDLWGMDVSNLSKFSFEYGDVDLTTGVSYRGEDTRGSLHTAALEGWLTPRDGIRHEVAGFAKAAYMPTDWLTLNAGLRYSHFWSKDRVDPYERTQVTNDRVVLGYTTDAGGFSPSVGVVVEPVEGGQLYANYSNAMRAPSIIESVSAFNSMVANDAVKPERSSNWEVGVNYTHSDLLTQDDKGMVKLGYFNWNVKDYISRGIIVDPTNPNALALNIGNIDRAKFSGLEFSGRYEIAGFTADLAANYFLNVEYCRTADTCDSKSLYADYATNHVQPEYAIDLTLSQKLFEDRLTVGGRVSYTGPRAIGHGDVTAQGAQQFISPISWDPYTLVDVFAEYKLSDSVTASVRVENLFDRYYIDPLGLVAQPGPGRTFYASLSGTLGGDQKFPDLPSALSGNADAAGTRDWSGLYAGVHAGGGFGQIKGNTTAGDGSADATAATESADLKLNSGVFGVQAGYNWQFDNRMVLGVEMDWGKTWMNGKQKAVSTEGGLGALGAAQALTYYDIDWTSSLRGRLGYVAGDRWMLYGTAGLALAQESQSREQYKSSNGSSSSLGTETIVASVEQASKTRLGYTVGTGVEYAINDRWTISGNYGYSHFGKRSFSFDTARAGVGSAYTEMNQVGTEIQPALLAPDHPLCTRATPHSRCSAMEVPIYETTDHESTYDVENGRKASNSFDIHTINIGLNYRF